MEYKTYRSRMNKILSLAKRLKLERQENPNSANVKKNMPEVHMNDMVVIDTDENIPNRFWNPAMSFLRVHNQMLRETLKMNART